MINKGSVRRKSKEVFSRVITLRKRGFSYSEIGRETGIAKSTINNWLTLAGLTLTKEHLLIQAKKRVENNVIATAASKITRAKRKDEDIQNFIFANKKYFTDPLFVAGIMLYEAEGSKGGNNGFSNSNYKLILAFIIFLEKYLQLNRNKDLSFRLYIHDSRNEDLSRLINFWSRKLSINPSIIKISWKHNIVTERRFNLDYVGQFSIHICGVKHITSKILAVSDIMLTVFQKK